MGESSEIELKFSVDASDLRTVQGHALLAGSASGTRETATIYYDTADRRLAKAGIALRVRRDGDRCVQTVKAALPGEWFKRGEWEAPVADEGVDRARLAGTPAGDLLADGTDLAPVFTVAVERRTYDVAWQGARIEVALDAGHVRCGRSSAPISEVEFELKAGRPAALFSLARGVADSVPLRLGVRSKAERGYALAERRAEQASKADPIPLRRALSAGDAFQVIARACLRHMRLNEDVLLARRDPEALHQLRVSLRRLRAAISLFGDVLDDAVAPELRERLRTLLVPLGRARDLDVLVAQTLPAERARRPEEGALLNLEKRAEMERTAAYKAVAALLRSPAWRTAILDVVAWIEAGPWLRAEGEQAALRDLPAHRFAREVLERRRRKVKKQGRHLDRLDPHARHRVRIAAKKLRYGAEFFGALFTGGKGQARHADFVAALSDLQDVLGELNDLVTGHAVLSGLSDGAGVLPSTEFAAGLAAADAEARSDALLRRARKRHAAFADAKPFWR
jgi:triphosphatase